MQCTQRGLLIFEEKSQANLTQMHNSSKDDAGYSYASTRAAWLKDTLTSQKDISE